VTDAGGAGRREPTRRGLLLCAGGSSFSAVVVLYGVFGALPARWAPVDVTAAVLGALLVASASAIVAKMRFALMLARVAAFVSLGAGLALVLVLALTASYLSGIYGPAGKGGAIVLVFVAALVVPYFIAIPAAQLLYLGPRKSKSSA
jgi:hypothetical protein